MNGLLLLKKFHPWTLKCLTNTTIIAVKLCAANNKLRSNTSSKRLNLFAQVSKQQRLKILKESRENFENIYMVSKLVMINLSRTLTRSKSHARISLKYKTLRQTKWLCVKCRNVESLLHGLLILGR